MAEEFEAAPAGICGGAWWSSSRGVPAGILSPCSSGIGAEAGVMALQCKDSKPGMLYANANVNSLVPSQKPQTTDSDSGGSSVTMDSTLQMMGLGFSSPGTFSPDWNQSLMQGNGRVDGYSCMMQQEINSAMIEPPSFPYNTALIQSLFEPDHQPHQHLDQSSVLQNTPTLDYHYMSGATASNCCNDFFPPHSFPKMDGFSKQSIPNPNQQSTRSLNISTPALLNTFMPCPQPQPSLLVTSFGQKLASRPTTVTRKCPADESRGSSRPGFAKKAKDEPATKRSRVATPSSLPTFKVRKENLRDQITSLQQLVSPFGKTDTASVLQEAIVYIKFLHEQVNTLTTPYMKRGPSVQRPQEGDGNHQGLGSRGLCLMSITSTIPVANETTEDFWTPNYGSNFR